MFTILGTKRKLFSTIILFACYKQKYWNFMKNYYDPSQAKNECFKCELGQHQMIGADEKHDQRGL